MRGGGVSTRCVLEGARGTASARDEDHLDRGGGSATLLVVLITVCLAVLCAGLASVLLVAQNAQRDEDAGRAALRRGDNAVFRLCVDAAGTWIPREFALPAGAGGLVTLPTTTTELPAGPVPGAVPGYLQATVWVPTSAGRRETSVDLESGRDGLDLPRAVIVAERILVAPSRAAPTVSSQQAPVPSPPEPETAPVALMNTAPDGGLPVDWPFTLLAEPWQLDEGTRLRLSGAAAEALTTDASALQGSRGATLRWSARGPEGTAERPAMVVVTGGADLDLTGLGELFGVVVVDGGSAHIEGTTVHGAIYASGALDCGGAGTVVWDPAVYRWARYGSTVRVRPVPGSRGERLVVTSTTVPTAGP